MCDILSTHCSFFFFLLQTFSKPLSLSDSPPPLGRKEEGGVIQAGSPEHPFWSCSEEHGLGNLCSAESRLQREGDRGRGYTGERGCNGEWQRERERERMNERKRGRGYERRARTEPRQRMIRPGGFRCCFGVRLGMGSCFCNSRREGERETHIWEAETQQCCIVDSSKSLSAFGFFSPI